MTKYRCLQTWAPLRKEASSTSEMVSSLLFGETCTVLDTHNDWKHVVCDFDGYTGWIPESYLNGITEAEVWDIAVHGHRVSLVEGDQRVHISIGSTIPNNPEIVIDGQVWTLEDNSAHYPLTPWQVAHSLLHVPYLWGGRSDCGIDCSGLSQICFKVFGIQIARDSADQAKQGKDVAFGDHLPNDLAFFSNAQGKITHVGIIAPEGIVHASGKVRLDMLTAEGILHSQSKTITHQLSCIKRLI